MNRYLGSVKFNHINVFLQQEPYLADSKLFTAIGQDEDGQEYKIEWEPLEYEVDEDILQCCICGDDTTFSGLTICQYCWNACVITPFIINNQAKDHE